VPPGVFNGFSARLVERAGYRAAAISLKRSPSYEK
jgi:2-methylisocitrate lyase-like PEP mutase family enzyme